MKKILFVLLLLPVLASAQNKKKFYGNEYFQDSIFFNGKIQYNVGSSLNGKILTSDASGNASWQSFPTEGTYTPTLTNTTNIAASTAYTTYYTKIGDTYFVWGAVDIDATAATTISEMGFSLPVSSSVGQIYDIAGTAAFEDNTAVQIKGDVANGRAVWRFTPQTSTNNKYSFHFTFKYYTP